MRQMNMMVGIPASGKDTYIELSKGEDDVVVSSDDVREMLYGDASIQGDASKVFAQVHKLLADAMSNGKTVWYNATNVTIKSRAQALDLAKKYGYKVVCFVMATPIQTCVVYDLNRDRHVTKEVINKFVNRFQFPVEKDIDEIHIVRNAIATPSPLNIGELLDDMREFSQASKFHKEDLYTHSYNAFKFFNDTIWNTIPNKDLATTLSVYALLHDYGKLFTRTIELVNGVPTHHFYNHENVGAYRLLTSFTAPNNVSDEMLIEGIRLVNYHMLMHNNVSEKKLNRMNDFTLDLIKRFVEIDILASEREE